LPFLSSKVPLKADYSTGSLLLDINREITLIVALDKELSSEWIAALFLSIFGEKNYYYECEVDRRTAYSPYNLWLMY
jgi:hypothetical protein